MGNQDRSLAISDLKLRERRALKAPQIHSSSESIFVAPRLSPPNPGGVSMVFPVVAFPVVVLVVTVIILVVVFLGRLLPGSRVAPHHVAVVLLR